MIMTTTGKLVVTLKGARGVNGYDVQEYESDPYSYGGQGANGGTVIGEIRYAPGDVITIGAVAGGLGYGGDPGHGGAGAAVIKNGVVVALAGGGGGGAAAAYASNGAAGLYGGTNGDISGALVGGNGSARGGGGGGGIYTGSVAAPGGAGNVGGKGSLNYVGGMSSVTTNTANSNTGAVVHTYVDYPDPPTVLFPHNF